MQAGPLLLALARDAGADHLGEPVDVRAHDAEAGVDLASHGLGPRLGAEQRVAEAELVGRHSALAKGLRERQRVARRARYYVRPEILDQHQLALGEAARDGNDRQTQPLAAVMKPEPAGEEPVAVRVVQEHPGLPSRRRE